MLILVTSSSQIEFLMAHSDCLDAFLACLKSVKEIGTILKRFRSPSNRYECFHGLSLGCLSRHFSRSTKREWATLLETVSGLLKIQDVLDAYLEHLPPEDNEAMKNLNVLKEIRETITDDVSAIQYMIR
jgi:hypothetical protein